MSVEPYTKKALIQRIRKHVVNSRFVNDDFSVSDKEILYYIDSALAASAIGQIIGMAKVSGNIATPEAYLTTYNLTGLAQDNNTSYWYVTLPQPPISLPLGYSITRGYFASQADGISDDIIWISAKRLPYRNNLPMMTGVRGWVENKILWLTASNNQPLINKNLYISMVKTRTDSMNEDMALPDDVIQAIFDKVVSELLQRYGVPQDVIADNLSAGNKQS